MWVVGKGEGGELGLLRMLRALRMGEGNSMGRGALVLVGIDGVGRG
jgi:hypothetical protein